MQASGRWTRWSRLSAVLRFCLGLFQSSHEQLEPPDQACESFLIHLPEILPVKKPVPRSACCLSDLVQPVPGTLSPFTSSYVSGVFPTLYHLGTYIDKPGFGIYNYRLHDPGHTSQIYFDLVSIGPTRASVGG